MKNLSVKEDTLEGSYSHKTTFCADWKNLWSNFMQLC